MAGNLLHPLPCTSNQTSKMPRLACNAVKSCSVTWLSVWLFSTMVAGTSNTSSIDNWTMPGPVIRKQLMGFKTVDPRLGKGKDAPRFCVQVIILLLGTLRASTRCLAGQNKPAPNSAAPSKAMMKYLVSRAIVSIPRILTLLYTIRLPCEKYGLLALCAGLWDDLKTQTARNEKIIKNTAHF